MFKVGITGGIGSGKSTVCDFFRLLGIPVFHADYEAKKIMNESVIVKNKLIMHFGKNIYRPNHTIDRKKLAGIIFNSPFLLETVNSIVHPEVRTYFFAWCERQKSPYIIHEAAILFESGFAKMMDYTILISAPEQQRIKWVMNRDNSSEKEIRERISKQWPDEKKQRLADITIENNNRKLIIPKLVELDKKFRTHG